MSSEPRPWPLIVPAPEAGKLDDFKNTVRQAARAFMDEYTAYFAHHKARANGASYARSPAPRRAGAGPRTVRAWRDRRRMRVIAADVAEAAAEGISGRGSDRRVSSRSPKPTLFDVEYWPLELAKLGQRKPVAARRSDCGRSPEPAALLAAATAHAFAEAGARSCAARHRR